MEFDNKVFDNTRPQASKIGIETSRARNSLLNLNQVEDYKAVWGCGGYEINVFKVQKSGV